MARPKKIAGATKEAAAKIEALNEKTENEAIETIEDKEEEVITTEEPIVEETVETVEGNEEDSAAEEVLDEVEEPITETLEESDNVEDVVEEKTEAIKYTKEDILEMISAIKDIDKDETFIQKVCNILKITRVKKVNNRPTKSRFWGMGRWMGTQIDY